MANPVNFNRPDGKGYEFVADRVLEIDAFNPQVAARLLSAFRSWKALEADRRRLAKKALQRIAKAKPLSRDASEIVGQDARNESRAGHRREFFVARRFRTLDKDARFTSKCSCDSSRVFRRRIRSGSTAFRYNSVEGQGMTPGTSPRPPGDSVHALDGGGEGSSHEALTRLRGSAAALAARGAGAGASGVAVLYLAGLGIVLTTAWHAPAACRRGYDRRLSGLAPGLPDGDRGGSRAADPGRPRQRRGRPARASLAPPRPAASERADGADEPRAAHPAQCRDRLLRRDAARVARAAGQRPLPGVCPPHQRERRTPAEVLGGGAGRHRGDDGADGRPASRQARAALCRDAAARCMAGRQAHDPGRPSRGWR